MLDLSRFAPPGIDWRKERNALCWGLAGQSVYSMQFLLRFVSARSALYWINGSYRKLKEDVAMVDFETLLEGVFLGVPVFWLAALGFALWHYGYHHMESKSIYLMRRLPDSRERHRRCWALPAAACALSLLSAFALLMLYYGIYMAFTPEQCLTPGQWQKLWR